MSLKDAIKWYLLKFYSKDYSYNIKVELEKEIPSDTQVQIYRITQESIVNARKHIPKSEALEIEIKSIAKRITVCKK